MTLFWQFAKILSFSAIFQAHVILSLWWNKNYYFLLLLVWNTEPENGETGLHLAACKNNEKMISFLLDHGASPNMVDLKGRSPAMRAAEFGHIQALTLLVEADTDLSSKESRQ